MITKIISGHQTGVDIGAIDAAISLGLPTGGFIPKGRITEDGSLDSCYANVITLDTVDYPARTRRNVETGDTTVCFYRGVIGQGTSLTIKIASEKDKDHHVYDLSKYDEHEIIDELADMLSGVVNWAGTRESKSPGIRAETYRIVREIIKKQRRKH